MIRETIRLSSAEGSAAPGAHEQLEILISRLADGEGAPSDWTSFGALATKVPDAWEQLARAQRDHAALSVAVGVALHAAERVELPSRTTAERFANVGAKYDGHQGEAGWSRVRTWGGWAAAAALILAWTTGGLNRLGLHVQTPGPVASIIPAGYQKVETPEDALKLYKSMGAKSDQFQVLGEMPQHVLVERRPTADGKGTETTYFRLLIEKRIVTELCSFGAVDEAGKPVLVPVKPETTPDTPQ